MSTTRYRNLFAAALTAVLALPALAGGDPAQIEQERLERCLKAFGLDWRLPYAPALAVMRCESAEASYQGTQPAPPGQPRLELITGNVDFIDDGHGNLSFADEHNAVFAHFDALFRSQGFRSAGVETDNDPAPWVHRAQYLRDDAGGRSTLQFEAEGGNTWMIRLRQDPVAGK